ncbi:MAG: hypothetical protein ACHQ15_09180, partial [Candidatus Limnocylindrales bacterium]
MTTAADRDGSLPIRTQARQAVGRAWERAVAAGALPGLAPDVDAPVIDIERPSKPEHGDLSTNLAMKLARPHRRAPLEIARILAEELGREASTAPGLTPLASAEAVAPGFVNMRLSDEALR